MKQTNQKGMAVLVSSKKDVGVPETGGNSGSSGTFSPALPKKFGRASWRLLPSSGRSMVEMLAVLAIIGILSVAALAGLTYAMNKHRANTIYNDVHLLALHVMDTGKDIVPADFYPDSGKTFTLDTTTYADGFVVKVAAVSKKVCDRIMEVNDPSIEKIYVGSEETTNCSGTQTMGFMFLYDGTFTSGGTSGGSGSGSGEPVDPCEGIIASTDCSITADETDSNGCVTVKKITCTGDTYCSGSTCDPCPAAETCAGESCCALTGPNDVCGRPTKEVGTVTTVTHSDLNANGCCEETTEESCSLNPVTPRTCTPTCDGTCESDGSCYPNCETGYSYNETAEKCCEELIPDSSGGVCEILTEASTGVCPTITTAQASQYATQYQNKAGCCEILPDGVQLVIKQDAGYRNLFCCRPEDSAYNAGPSSYLGVQHNCCPPIDPDTGTEMEVVFSGGSDTKCCTKGSSFNTCCQPGDNPLYVHTERDGDYCCPPGTKGATKMTNQYQGPGCCGVVDGIRLEGMIDPGYRNMHCCKPGDVAFNGNPRSYKNLVEGCCPTTDPDTGIEMVRVQNGSDTLCCTKGSSFNTCCQPGDNPLYVHTERDGDYCCPPGTKGASKYDSHYQSAGCCGYVDGVQLEGITDPGYGNMFCCKPGDQAYNGGFASYQDRTLGCCPPTDPATGKKMVLVWSNSDTACCVEGSTYSNCIQP